MTTKDMLHVIINEQREMKAEIAVLRKETKQGFKATHERLDKQGKKLAYLEDDSPTQEDFAALTKRVDEVEKVLIH